MGQKFTNAARAILTDGISASATTIDIGSYGELFPKADTGNSEVGHDKDWFKAVLQEENFIEIIYVRTHNGDGQFTDVLRGQEGTTARAFKAGSVLGLRQTAKDAQDTYDTLQEVHNAIDDKADKSWVEDQINTIVINNPTSKLDVALGVIYNGDQTVDDVWEFSYDGITWQQGTVEGGRYAYVRRVDGGTVMFNPPSSIQIKEIRYWGDKITQLSLIGGYHLISVPNKLPRDVTNLFQMFQNATQFNQDISGWSTSQVTNMNYMFRGATAFNQDLSSWDGSNAAHVDFALNAGFENEPEKHPMWVSPVYRHSNGVTIAVTSAAQEDTFYQFEGEWYYVAGNTPALKNKFVDVFKDEEGEDVQRPITDKYRITKTIPLNRVITSRVTNMSSMFYNVPSFNQAINAWDTSNVTIMHRMFFHAPSFNQDISAWDTSSVVDMRQMFSSASSFNQDISAWDTSKVTHMGSMFSGASSFNQDLSGWCVSNISTKPSGFDYGTHPDFQSNAAKQPQWGTCPRGEDQ